MRQIKSHNASFVLARLSNASHVENLAGGIVHPSQQDQGNGITFAIDQ